MTAQEITEKIKQDLPDAEVVVRDLTGGNDHFEAIIVCDSFEGKSRVKRHQQIYGILGTAMQQEIHALALKTWTFAEFKKMHGNS